MTAPLFLRPAFQQRIWGGRQLATRYGYHLPQGPVGECWGISAHPNGPSRVINGPHAGRSLADVWAADPSFFGGHDGGPFPLLVKFLDAEDWLSVQVHPNDAEAAELEGVPMGKTECWYVAAARAGAELIIGHRAASRRELASMIDAGRWNDLLLRRPVSPGDFVYVPSGTVHAVGPGLLVYEVQQNSDATYRVYDFDRTDDRGNRRELHLDKAKRVLTAPYDRSTTDTSEVARSVPGGARRTLVRGEYFETTLHQVDGEYTASFPGFELCSVIDGSGELAYDGQQHPLAAGDHLVLPADAGRVRFSGTMTVVSSRAR